METRREIFVNGVFVGYEVDGGAGSTEEVRTPRMTKGTFIDRFTIPKHADLLERAKIDPILAAAKHSLDVRDWIDVTNPNTIQMVQYMVSLEIFTPAEGEALLEDLPVSHPGAIS